MKLEKNYIKLNLKKDQFQMPKDCTQSIWLQFLQINSWKVNHKRIDIIRFD